jgi:hypothetical protein
MKILVNRYAPPHSPLPCTSEHEICPKLGGLLLSRRVTRNFLLWTDTFLFLRLESFEVILNVSPLYYLNLLIMLIIQNQLILINKSSNIRTSFFPNNLPHHSFLSAKIKETRWARFGPVSTKTTQISRSSPCQLHPHLVFWLLPKKLVFDSVFFGKKLVSKIFKD